MRILFRCVTLNATYLTIPQIWPWLKSVVVGCVVSGHGLSYVAVVLVSRGAPITTRDVGCGSTNIGGGIPATGATREMRSGRKMNNLGGCLE